MEVHPLETSFLIDLYNIWDAYTNNGSEYFSSYIKNYQKESKIEFTPLIKGSNLCIEYKNETYTVFAFQIEEKLPFSNDIFYWKFALPLNFSQVNAYEYILCLYGIYSTQYTELNNRKINQLKCVYEKTKLRNVVYYKEDKALRTIDYMNTIKDKIFTIEKIIVDKIENWMLYKEVDTYEGEKGYILLECIDQSPLLPKKIELFCAQGIFVNNILKYLERMLMVCSDNIQISIDKSTNESLLNIKNSIPKYFSTCSGVKFVHLFTCDTTVEEICKTLEYFSDLSSYDVSLYNKKEEKLEPTLTAKDVDEELIIIPNYKKSDALFSKMTLNDGYKSIELKRAYVEENKHYDFQIKEDFTVGEIAYLLKGKYGFQVPNTSFLTEKCFPVNRKAAVSSLLSKSPTWKLMFRSQNNIFIQPTKYALTNGMDVGVFSECTEEEGKFILNLLGKEVKEKVEFKTSERKEKTDQCKPVSSIFCFGNAKKERDYIIKKFVDDYFDVSKKQEEQLRQHFYEFENPLDQGSMIDFIEPNTI